MPNLLLKARLALELPEINRALDTLIEKLPAPVRPAAGHTITAGGKRLRPLLTVLTAKLFGCRDRKIYPLSCTLEMLHAATLMHDDVIDNAPTRRGKPAAHTLHGVTETILAGDALLAAANDFVASYGSPALCSIFSRATYETAAGEILELHALHNVSLTLSEYTDIIRGKTACLIRSACEMGAVFAGAPDESVRAISAFGENIGMAFQMVDDALDCASEESTGKPTGGDLREGKLTPPLQLYRLGLGGEERGAFDKSFSEGTFTSEEIESICADIRGRGLDTKVRKEADVYLTRAREALEKTPDCAERRILMQMADFVRDRRK